jgi:hypothetical protein
VTTGDLLFVVMYYQHNQFDLRHTVSQASLLAVAFVLIGCFVFVLFEPTVTRGAIPATSTFTIRQEINNEISFQTPAANVTMVGNLAGLSGGTATGSTYAIVRSNSAGGYNMTISFSGAPAMRGEASGSTAILDYGTTSEPTFGLVASSSAYFAYTVDAEDPSDIDPSFYDDGDECAMGAGFTALNCWKGPSTTNFMIINRSSPTGDGATTTLHFRVIVPSNPNPTVVEDFYTATATLTATAQ